LFALQNSSHFTVEETDLWKKTELKEQAATGKPANKSKGKSARQDRVSSSTSNKKRKVSSGPEPAIIASSGSDKTWKEKEGKERGEEKKKSVDSSAKAPEDLAVHATVCWECKFGQFHRSKHSLRQCRKQKGGDVKGAMGHTECDWQEDQRTDPSLAFMS